MKSKSLTQLRSMMILSLEVFLAVAILALFGYLPISVPYLLGAPLAGIFLTTLGCWLYQGGNGSMVYYVMLYPLIGIVFFVSYQIVGLFLAALLAAAYYWRIHLAVSNQFGDQNYMNRYTYSTLTLIAALVYYIFISVEVTPIFWLLAVSTVWYLLIRWGEHVTRSKFGQEQFSAEVFRQFFIQVASSQILFVSGYLISFGFVLFLLWGMWQVIKGPLTTAFIYVMGPILTSIIAWLSSLINDNKKIKVIVDRYLGPPANRPEDEGTVHQGPSLIDQLEPYLIGITIALVILIVGYSIWKQRYRKTGEQEQVLLSKNKVRSLDPTPSTSPSIREQLQSWLQRWRTPQDDIVRVKYNEFLHYMASHGISIRQDETPTEFLGRIRLVLADQDKLGLANRITAYYERHRYDAKNLSADEIKQFAATVEQIRR
ncbi:DUF4129 domain-containing protein [Brevibacillus sp. SYSU BS000544]|uniref:DUF4129 domain-containing protein n=1 Tax=Brevibacillus sp. SYSU BS000544 TaxID=3416443 RepID=UPI003CE46EC4